MRTAVRRMATITLTCITVAALAALWPTRLGGAASYVTTHGTSMEPAFHQGDLAVVRASSTYRVGEVVAYRSRLLDTVVLHRIVAIDHGHYSFKGDNNSWQDAEHPVAANLIGRPWLHIPNGGFLLGWLHAPSHWPASIVIAVGAAAAIEPRRRRQRKRSPMPARSSSSSSAYSAARTVAAALMACAVGFAGLGAVALARRTTMTGEAKIPYTQRGTFTYLAVASPGPVYENGRAITGEPIYLRLADTVDVNFAYDFDADAAALDGTLTVRAVLSDSSGWRRTIELTPPTRFQGREAEGTATLELAPIEGLLAEVRSATGAGASTYTVDVVADVAVTGRLQGQRVHDTFAPHLEFHLDAMRLAPDAPPSDTSRGYETSTLGTATVRTAVANRLELRGRGINVEAARELAAVGMAITLIGAGIASVAARRRRPDPAGRIAMRYGPRIVGVEVAEVAGHLVVLDVASINDLARLADQHASLILHQKSNGHDTYSFQADRILYRYRLRQAEPAKRESRGRST